MSINEEQKVNRFPGMELNMKAKARWDELVGLSVVILGFVALIYYFSWWSYESRLSSPAYALWFFAALLFTIFQLLCVWAIDLAAFRRPQNRRASVNHLTTDVFLTTCGEPYDLVERSLSAACNMRGNYRVWLLDDGHDPQLKKLADALGTGYFTREDRQDAKAGNINAALARTTGDIVAIFDVDHVADPKFLERSLPLFAESDIGFVQVMLTSKNEDESVIAHAAAQATLDFYNPISVGSDRLGAATLIGSNALIRREALASIERYQPGLAEDLATSLALHAKGWRSAYVHEPLAPGLAPPDLAAWFTQQAKWSRGVFEVLLTAFPRLCHRLTLGQFISYGARMTYYWLGLAIAFHLFLAILGVWDSELLPAEVYNGYLKRLLPVWVMILLINQFSLLRWRHQSITLKESLFRLKAHVLVIGTWPAYLLTWVMALFRVPLTFRPTPKAPGGLLSPAWIVPHLFVIVVTGVGLVRFIGSVDDIRPYWLLLAFLISMLAIQLFLPLYWLVEFVNKSRVDRSAALD
jgi:cellulose synthase (UDP-forming)